MPRTLTVSNSRELYSAMASATGGDTILLKGGNYGGLHLNMASGFDFTYGSKVTIRSADRDDPAVFTTADVRGAGNLALDGIKFDYTFKPGDIISKRPFNFADCTNLTISNSTFDGDLASGVSATSDGFGYGIGLSVRSSTNTVVENNEFFNFHRAAYMHNSTATTVRGNDVHDIRMDGLVFSTMKGVVVENNHIHDFRGSMTSGDHSDMIQFWTAGTWSPSTNITIRGNKLDIGQGTWTQSIFMRNEQVDAGGQGAYMFYKNVLIENNTIINAHRNAISVGETAGLTIRNNSVLHSDGGRQDGGDAGVEIPGIVVAPRSTTVAVVQNITNSISGHNGQAGWTVRNNVMVQDQDPFAANHYENLFVDSTLQPAEGDADFITLPGSVIDRLNAGSNATQFPASGLVAMFNLDEADSATRVFDAGATRFNGATPPAGTTYTWTFGDGSTAQGQKVSHSYTAGGQFDATLTVRLPDGRTDSTDLMVAVESAEVLSLSDQGHFVAYEDGAPVVLGPLARFSGTGLELPATGVATIVGRHHVVDVVGSDNMTIAFTLDTDRPGTSGELFRLQGSFMAGVTSTGELQVRITPEGGAGQYVTTSGARLNDGGASDVVIHFDDGSLQVWVDGRLAGEKAISGVIGGATGYGSQNLNFGHPWGGANFRGELRSFELSVGSDDYPPRPETVVLSGATARVAGADDTALLATALAAVPEDDDAPDAPDADDDRFEFGSLDAVA